MYLSGESIIKISRLNPGLLSNFDDDGASTGRSGAFGLGLTQGVLVGAREFPPRSTYSVNSRILCCRNIESTLTPPLPPPS
jgi:hypothetical protein